MNMKMCLNWKVLAGLAAVGVAVLVFQPQLIGRALPLLLVAACPLSMLLMMGGMAKMGGKPASVPSLPESSVAGGGSSRDEQLADLRAQLVDVHAREAALTAYIRALEQPEPQQLPAGRPAIEDQARARVPAAQTDPAG